MKDFVHKEDLGELQDKIGYRFKREAYLEQALTHSSYANEGHKHLRNNERLEFLGDSVLSVIVARYLFLNYKDLPEGVLTKMRASLVCEKALDVFAGELGGHGAADMLQTEKIALIKKINPQAEIGWDGGVTVENVRALARAGVNAINVGAAILNATDRAAAYNELKTEAEQRGVRI